MKVTCVGQDVLTAVMYGDCFSRIGSVSEKTSIQLAPQESVVGTGRYMTLIYNNETNSIDEVIAVLMVATGCDFEEAAIETWEAHHYGAAPVHFSDKEECESVATIVGSIGVATEVKREWEDA